MTAIARELEEIERHGWQALSGPSGADFYDELMADDGLMAFPGAVFDKQATVRAIADARPWATFEMSEVRVIEASPQTGIVTYRATAQREGEAPYHALFTSVYARRDGSWRLMLHQQTPDPDGD